ncbi:MAG TPA: globin, partial [Pseudoclavibacter sp.]|nr:globin [Pseudoclavibacter sp.]
MSFYDEIGGESTIAAIARGFYARVATDPVLLPLY